MKVIHCADLHLDSKCNANLDRECAKERRSELLHTFERMVEYAAHNHVAAILIAGDLFDSKNISATTRNTILYCMQRNPGIQFYCLRGNHDSESFLRDLEETPANLHLFRREWTSYRAGNVVISGIELTRENAGSAYLSLVLDSKDFNIVMLHGQEAEGNAGDKTETVNLKALRNKGIDYLALGHVHAYKKETLDARGTYCYCGCLEGRGFDECGEHGFVLIDIDETSRKYTHEFVPFAKRRLYEVPVDVTGCRTTSEMRVQVTAALRKARCGAESLVKIVLTGELDVECEKDIIYLLSCFKPYFYFVKIDDKTTLKVDEENYLLDASLKGEYVRMVMSASELSEEDKKAIIRWGLQAISGEEVQP